MQNPLAGLKVTPPIFERYMQPFGGLNAERETHALFYYYLLARKNWEDEIGGIVYEGSPDPIFAYLQLFKSIANLYGVEPEAMEKCWSEVDYTCAMHDLPKLPETSKLRHYSQQPIILN